MPTKSKIGDVCLVDTQGNHSFVLFFDNHPLVVKGPSLGEGVETLVLVAMEMFEKSHPELEVVGWQVQTGQSKVTGDVYYRGIWVHHRPRTTTVAPRLRQDVSSPHDIGCDAG